MTSMDDLAGALKRKRKVRTRERHHSLSFLRVRLIYKTAQNCFFFVLFSVHKYDYHKLVVCERSEVVKILRVCA